MTFGGTAYGSTTSEVDVTDQPAPVPASGWHVVVTHPSTGRRLRPDVLDEPAILPSLNSLPEIRIPVRKSDVWLDPSWENNPGNATLDVYLDGVAQPIDELNEIEDREDRTILVGVGATELRDRVTAEYRNKRRHIAAKELVQNNTSYTEDVDTPSIDGQDDQVQQEPTTNADFQDLFSFSNTDAIAIQNDNIELLQSAYHIEAEDFSLTGSASDGDSSEGTLENLGTDTSDTESVTIEYTIDSTNARLAFRKREPTGTGYGHTISVDGSVVETFADSYVGQASYEWSHVDIGSSVSGSTNITIDGNADGGGETEYDLFVIYDDQYSYTFDNSVDGNNHLSGPELYPDQIEIVSDDSQTAFAYVAAALDVTMNDTSNNQRIQVSNDRGTSYVPSDGTEDNTASIDETFSDGDTYLRARIRLSRYGSGGSSTPTSGFNGQILNDYTLEADIDFQLLLVDQTFDNSLVSVLNEIATSKYLWSANLDSNGDYQISWTQPGQRTASGDPDIANISVSKNIDTYDKVLIFGSNKDISDESFNANSTFTSLNNNDIIPGSESVYDSSTSTTFDRSDDYEMDYSAGEIRATNGGALDTTQSYTIDYSTEISGSYPPNLSSPDREFVETVPGVVSNRGAEQIAFVLQTDNDTPIYSADVTLPREDVTFNPIESLPLAQIDLPSEATPLEVRSDPRISPSGLELRLGSRAPIEESLGSIAETVSQVSKRT